MTQFSSLWTAHTRGGCEVHETRLVRLYQACRFSRIKRSVRSFFFKSLYHFYFYIYLLSYLFYFYFIFPSNSLYTTLFFLSFHFFSNLIQIFLCNLVLSLFIYYLNRLTFTLGLFVSIFVFFLCSLCFTLFSFSTYLAFPSHILTFLSLV